LSADGGTAAILGAQQASSTKPVFRNPLSNAGLSADSLNTESGVNIRPAGPPAPATDGTGGTVSPPVSTTGPPKLPESGATPGQVAAALNAQRIADLRARAAGTAPKYSPVTNPAVQKIATDGG
jgi:hypothetical protein